MSRTIATFLLDAAAWITPPHRRQWIEGLRAEAAVAEHPTVWAWGALTTAVRQRLADALVSGLALRLVLGGFVIFTAAGSVVFVAVRFPNMEIVAARRSIDLFPLTLAFAAFVLLMLSGGLAILFSAGRPWLNRYGRVLFCLGALNSSLNQIATAYGSMHFHRFTHMGELATIAGPLFIVAALALLSRRPRLFVLTALGALGMMVSEWGVNGGVAPALLLLAGGGLLIERRTPVTA